MVMELVSASDLLVTASMALLLSFLVAKLVSLAMTTTTTDTHNTTHPHVHDQPVGPVLQNEPRFTVQSPQIESRVGFINPVQLTTTVDTTTEFVEDAAFESTEANTLVEEIKKDSIVNSTSIESGLESVDITDLGSVIPTSKETISEFETQNPNSNSQESNLTDTSSANGRDCDEGDGDWEWEGIERSEMEKVFMAATEFIAEKGFGGGDDLEMELYGLHKVAMEGPCRESQPMTLKLSARAKWNAWQKLGNMSPEVAMERYISILSEKFPRWMEDTSGVTEPEPTGSEDSQSAITDLSSSLSHQQKIATERELDRESGALDHNPLTETDLEKNVKN